MSKIGDFAGGVFVGAVIGTAIGFLFAPESGEDLRRKIKEGVEDAFCDIADCSAEYGQTIKQHVTEIGGVISEKIAQYKAKVEEKFEEFQDEMEEVLEEIQEELEEVEVESEEAEAAEEELEEEIED